MTLGRNENGEIEKSLTKKKFTIEKSLTQKNLHLIHKKII